MRRYSKRISLLVALVMLLSTVLTACNTGGTGDDSKGDSKGSREIMDSMLEIFPDKTPNKAASIDGGILKFAIVSNSAFQGLFQTVVYEDAVDAEVLGFISEEFLSTDENLVFSQEGICTYTYDVEAKTMTLTQVHDVKWHDGEPATLDDLLFTFEIICHPDYDGVRYDDSYMNMVGAEEFHAGTADKISGITLSDDEKTMTIQFKEFYPSILIAGFMSTPTPRHDFEGVAVKDIKNSAQVRQRPLGIGPFKFKSMVPGEAVEVERFDDYWQGKPKLAGATLEVIAPDMVPTAMEEGRFDIADFSAQQYADYKEPTNYLYLSSVSRGYDYTGFRLGTFNTTTNSVELNPDSKVADVNLRKAMAYAIDNASLGRDYYNNLRFPASSIVSPFHAGYIDWDIEGYSYDPEQSKKILDDAGYADVDGDGFREDPNGNQLTLTWAMMDGENADTRAQFKIQCWEEIGIRVELFNGRLTEFNAFYDFIQHDTDDGVIDMYDGAWSVGYDPNPAGIWGSDAMFNFTRYTSDNFKAILADIASEKAWDNEWLSERYSAWQQAFYEEVPAFPNLWRLDLVAVNNRVKNYSLERLDGTSKVSLGALWLVELTADQTEAK